MEVRNLEKVRSIIKDATGLDVSYAYDDLVFPDHTAFIVQFDDENAKNYFCYFQEECKTEERNKILDSLATACSKEKCCITSKGSFRLEQKGDEVDIIFS
jgi:hypothetical protein